MSRFDPEGESMTATNISAPQRTTMTGLEWAMLLLLGLVWGGAFFFGRIAVAEMHPLALVFARVAIAAGALHIYLLWRGPSFRTALPLALPFFVLAVLNNVIPFSLIFTGQRELGAGLASIINATTPFWTVIAANILTADEKLSANKLAGIALGVAGTGLLVGPSALAGLGGPLWPKIAVLCATLSYAFAAIFARRFKAVPATIVATGQLTGSTFLMAPVVLLFSGPETLFASGVQTWSAVLALGLLSTAFAYILYFRLIASAGATNASLVTLVVPASAILLGVLFLGERLGGLELAGLALIAFGLVTIDGRLFKRR